MKTRPEIRRFNRKPYTLGSLTSSKPSISLRKRIAQNVMVARKLGTNVRVVNWANGQLGIYTRPSANPRIYNAREGLVRRITTRFRKSISPGEGAFSLTEDGLLLDEEIMADLEDNELTLEERQLIAAQSGITNEEVVELELRLIAAQKRQHTMSGLSFMEDYLAEVEGGGRPPSFEEAKAEVADRARMEDNLAALILQTSQGPITDLSDELASKVKEREELRKGRSPLAWGTAEVTSHGTPLPEDGRVLRELEESEADKIEAEHMLGRLTNSEVVPDNPVTEVFSWLLLDEEGGLIKNYDGDYPMDAGAQAVEDTTLITRPDGSPVPLSSTLGGIDVRLDWDSGLVASPHLEPAMRRRVDALLSIPSNAEGKYSRERNEGALELGKQLPIRVLAPGRVYSQDGEIVGYEIEPWVEDIDNSSSDNKVRSGGTALVYWDGKGYELDMQTKLPAKLQRWEQKSRANHQLARLFPPSDQFSPFVNEGRGAFRPGAGRVNPPTNFLVTPGSMALKGLPEFRDFAANDAKEALDAAKILAEDYGIPFFVLEGRDPPTIKSSGRRSGGMDYGRTREGVTSNAIQAVVMPTGEIKLPRMEAGVPTLAPEKAEFIKFQETLGISDEDIALLGEEEDDLTFLDRMGYDV